MHSKQSGMSDFKRCAGSSPFCLGMVDFDCCVVKNKLDNQENGNDDFQPPMKKGKLSLANGKKKVLSPSKRFNNTVTSDEIEQQSRVLFQKIPQDLQNGHTEHSSNGWKIVINSPVLKKSIHMIS